METTHTANHNSLRNSHLPKPKAATRSAEFVEDDLGKAAYLYAIGYCFLGLHNLGRGRFGFGFQDERGTAAQDAANYFQARVAPHSLVESLRSLKKILMLQRQQKHV